MSTDTIALPQRGDWESLLTVPECIDKLSSCSLHWDPEHRLSPTQIEALATRMTAKEYKQGDVIMEVGDPNNHVL
jgi:hypothetical protein